MTDRQFRHADEQDSKSIFYFVRAMLKEMESVGGHEVNPDETFWNSLHKEITESIRDANRLYWFGQIGK